ncbi:MAG TPA: aminotransferase class I/II-fold pyridoxal phosphate-dependent enzyme [Polyangiaceae bacterium]|nr:aminotransferase class I/II-fold pyridoxal phosphate-dependent enzyme [Polyangiaceae bacterium]
MSAPRPALDALLRPELAAARAYQPEPGPFVVRLDANEAPALWGPRARERFGAIARGAELNRYPDPAAAALKRSLAAYAGGAPDEYLVGAGSDEAIVILLSSLGRARAPGAAPRVVTVAPTFVMYRISAFVRGLEVLEVPLDERWRAPAGPLVEAIGRADPHVVFLATPNNPTGRVVEPDTMRAVVEGAPNALVVIDQAYGPYADERFDDWLGRYPNVALLGTLSKVGLAALRVGWLRARPELVRELDKMRSPYNLPALSQELAAAALDEFSDELGRIVGEVRRERAALARGLEGFGFEVTPSQSNFLWARAPVPADALCSKLATCGVALRHFSSQAGRLREYVRVTVGTQREHALLFQALRQVLPSAEGAPPT